MIKCAEVGGSGAGGAEIVLEEEKGIFKEEEEGCYSRISAEEGCCSRSRSAGGEVL